MPRQRITKRELYLNGIQKLGYTEKELSSEWKFCGGDFGINLRYFNKKYTDKKYNLINKDDICVCGDGGGGLYITKDDKSFLSLCWSCITPFKFEISFACDDCGASHKGWTSNLCAVCTKKRNIKTV